MTLPQVAVKWITHYEYSFPPILVVIGPSHMSSLLWYLASSPSILYVPVPIRVV